VQSAEVSVRQAERELEKATLLAPFDGVIGELNLNVGEAVSSSGNVAVVLADVSVWKIETEDLTERDAVRVALGLSANITFAALPETQLMGTVESIQPIGKDSFGDMTYTVTIIPDEQDAPLLWNMSALVTFELP
jgi:HlyD family secretion protein